MRAFAYCRVSTLDQDPAHQLRELESVCGVKFERRRVVFENISGSIDAGQRPGFQKLLDRMEPGDVLHVTKLDRLGRNAMDVRKTIEDLAARGVRVHCHQLGGADLTSSAGKLIMGIIGHMAEFERDLIVERTKAGLATAKANGARMGRPAALSADQIAEAHRAHRTGESLRSLGKRFGVSPQTVQKALEPSAQVA